MLKTWHVIVGIILGISGLLQAFEVIQPWVIWLVQLVSQDSLITTQLLEFSPIAQTVLYCSIAFGFGFFSYWGIEKWDDERRPLTEEMEWTVNHCNQILRKVNQSDAEAVAAVVQELSFRFAVFATYFDIPFPKLRQRQDHALQVATEYVTDVCIPMKAGERRRANTAARRFKGQ